MKHALRLISYCLLLVSCLVGQLYADDGRVFFVDAGGIYRASLAPGAPAGQIVGQPYVIEPTAIAVDSIAHKIYWANSAPASIWRADFDGGNPELIGQVPDAPRSLFVDWAYGKLYWVSGFGPGRLDRSNLDGTGVETMADGMVNPVALDLDVAHQTAYIADLEGGAIYRHVLGTFVTIPIVQEIFPVGLSYLPSAQRLYWQDFNEQMIFSCSSFGFDVQPLLSVPLQYGMGGLAIDSGAEPSLYMIYGNNLRSFDSAIGRSPLQSPMLQEFQVGSGLVSSFTLDLPCGSGSRDSDGDQVPDCLDECILDPDKHMAGFCGCGNSEFDSDSDGFPDCVDICPLDTQKFSPGVCGCNVPELPHDSDGDFLIDCFDACPFDPLKAFPDACGCGEISLSLSDGSIVCFSGVVVTKDTVLEMPEVKVAGRTVTIYFAEFNGIGDGNSVESTGAALRQSQSRRQRPVRPLSIKYEVQIKPAKGGPSARDIRALTTKRNQVTFRNLRPGGYSARYRVAISRGAKRIARTKFSPSVQFTIAAN